MFSVQHFLENNVRLILKSFIFLVHEFVFKVGVGLLAGAARDKLGRTEGNELNKGNESH